MYAWLSCPDMKTLPLSTSVSGEMRYMKPTGWPPTVMWSLATQAP